MKKIKYTKCKDCGGKFRVVHLWTNNFILGVGGRFLCEICFKERTAQNAQHLLDRYKKVMANRGDERIYEFFEKTYTKSSQDEQLIFIQLLGGGHGEQKNV